MNASAQQNPLPEFRLLIDGHAWKSIRSLEESGPDDEAFVLDPDSGQIIFGDGVHGRKPPVGSEARASYEFGAGHVVSVAWKVTRDVPGIATAALFEPGIDSALFKVRCAARGSLSDMLQGQVSRIRKITFGDLVLAVLPWPFHKDLPNTCGLPVKTRTDLIRLYLCGRFCLSLLDATADRSGASEKSREMLYPRWRVEPGDTLELISSRMYGSPTYILELARINRLTDIRALEAGTALILPPIEKKED